MSLVEFTDRLAVSSPEYFVNNNNNRYCENHINDLFVNIDLLTTPHCVSRHTARGICYTNHELRAINNISTCVVSHELHKTLTDFGLQSVLLDKRKRKNKRGSRGGRRKQKRISVRLTHHLVPNVRDTISHDTSQKQKLCINNANLVHIKCDQNFAADIRNFRIGYINTQSCRQKT